MKLIQIKSSGHYLSNVASNATLADGRVHTTPDTAAAMQFTADAAAAWMKRHNGGQFAAVDAPAPPPAA